ncbi:MAG TPA: hypothetical protein VHL99_07935 [Candidatus Binatia bacterium]|jgi:hypothetical protein|nr:hypothetical protein [Candidatus Binatia bacterium]
MSETTTEVKLRDGTLIRHKVIGYEGRTDGTTALKSCFTHQGAPLGNAPAKHAFQYRVLVSGEATRRVAPLEDLEILEGSAEQVCPACQVAFQSRPGHSNKPGGRCACGGWICPSCYMCQATPSCAKQRLRLVQRSGVKKKH